MTPFTHAIARQPGADMAAGITTADLGAPETATARAQFEAYVNALTGCGLAVTVLAPLDGHPDAHFVEDTAVVLPERAVIANPGAPSRRGEVDTIAAALSSFRETVAIRPPGTLDGGDVLMVGSHFFIGLSDRTNPDGADQLRDILAAHGYTVTLVPVADGLHFKSSVNAVAADTLLTTRAFAGHPAFGDFRQIVVPSGEAYAANTLRVNNRLIMPAGFPETRRLLQALGTPIVELDTSEFRKMDGGLTCLSLRF
jgi:dimethylargininase